MDSVTGPEDVIWDITYACPLRCSHCYSESGRRLARQLGPADLMRLTEAVLRWHPRSVTISGGEPLLVKGVFEVAHRLGEAGVERLLYTSGWTLDEALARQTVANFDRIIVSVDGATAAVHDGIRGRRGSFDRALNALDLLDRVAGDRVPFGVDYTVIRSNFDEIPDACELLGARLPHLRSISFGAAVPAGLASRADFAERELLTEEQRKRLIDPGFVAGLRARAPGNLRVSTSDNRILQMHPDRVRSAADFPAVQIEPDGAVRAMAIYEGTVGNLFTDEPDLVWQRAVDRWRDPFVVAALGPAHTATQWAEATRRIDTRYGSDDDRARIARRPAHR
ncbi:hypothetical protein Ait01nite_014660 [Actinoplanes italicus]|uniref:MoaA/NifB/PqqE/SkfB family radical SAM enzyme n=1 Tax=Actinoplanes italicus TaxID=113567 RepID=A0A2T0KHJ2_9ACTN|nr:radical SAM protein [Actinoplanes italicus]PRX22900.1 MoaA/NifB/PqqE/SkfB family radical SAM enzyme [Actinoplanes italicus]GIE28421.1 hypothetical protein Ait01nite_014660 [Actinoplanes italicus]